MQQSPIAGGDASTGAGSDEKVGGFDLQLVAPVAANGSAPGTPGLTRVVGVVTSSPAPSATILEVDRQEGDCTLRTPRVPFCERGCSGGVCVEDDQCEPNAQSVSLGTVTVSGLRSDAAAGSFELISVRNTYQIPGSVKVEYPPFAEGASIQFTASGAQFPAFSLQGRGIAPLELPATTNYRLEPGKPLALSWTAAGMPDVSKIHIKLDISHHGGSKGQIDCDVADNGQYTISAALLDRLVSLGVAGWPTVVLTRNTVSTASTASGQVDLNVYMYQERSVEIPGVISCVAEADCPNGQQCKANQTCAPK